MDIATHPCDQDIIASVSADSTARLWSIDPALRSQPCVLICAGNGHKETILTLVCDIHIPVQFNIRCSWQDYLKAFHASGRYLLTGGMDRLINLVSFNFPLSTILPLIAHSGCCLRLQLGKIVHLNEIKWRHWLTLTLLLRWCIVTG